MTQERSLVLEAYDFWEVDTSQFDWADKRAVDIAESFIAIDGNYNWHLPNFNWPALNKMIAHALREERKRHET